MSDSIVSYMLPRLKNRVFFSLIGVFFVIFVLFTTAYSTFFQINVPAAVNAFGLIIAIILTLTFIPLGILHRSSIVPIQLNQLSSLYYNLDPLPTDSEKSTTSETVQSIDGKRESEQLIEQAESLTVDMSTVGDKSALDDSIDDLSEALRYYRAAADKIDDPDREAEIETTVATLRENRNKLKAQLESQTTLNEALQAGEESFQEAIRAYVTDEKTLSRIRFRQARDRFEEASNTVKESDTELLSTPVTVAVTADRELPARNISDLRGFDSETAATLESEDITTVSDLTENEAEAVVTDEIAELSADNALSESVITRLTMLSWLHTQDTFDFCTREDISRRYKQAKRGFSEC